MHGILRDASHATVRLVMNPDRMVIKEAMRTFTYLNLYGYVTDAVVVNRLFPEEVGSYFGAWREVQQEHLALVESAFAPVPVLRAPYFEHEVVGAAMLERLAEAAFGSLDPAAVLYETLTQQLVIGDHDASLRIALPFARKGDISLKKIGAELVVRVDGHKRTMILPPALASYTPTEASFDDGALQVRFDGRERADTGERERG
jgi:arsenite-transporting ATPase